MQIVLLSGPPRAGKDTAAEMAVRFSDEAGKTAIRVGFADEVKRATHRLYGMDSTAPSMFEHCKDEPCDEFGGFTPRQAYQFVSESMKDRHGAEFWGIMLANRLEVVREFGVSVAFVSDSGFRDEARQLGRLFGWENITLVQVWRPGTTFEGDTRSYWTLPELKVPRKLFNDGSENLLRGRVGLLIRGLGIV